MMARLVVFAIVIAIVQSGVSIPLGLDLYMPVPERNPLSAETIAMGRRLFFDRRLSRDESISCATCHDPEHAFADGRALAVGIDGRFGRRNAPSLVNRGYGRLFFWDGRSRQLEEQVLKPIEDPNEMDLPSADAAARVGVSEDTLSRALASYVRTILSGDSRFDRYVAGDQTALSMEQRAGLDLFRGRARCVTCHIGPNFTDEKLHNTGVAWQGDHLSDEGAGRGEFKTPTLREVVATAPYMHDGSLATIDDVIDFYDGGGRQNPTLDSEIRPLHLKVEERRALASFLQSLSGVISFGR